METKQSPQMDELDALLAKLKEESEAYFSAAEAFEKHAREALPHIAAEAAMIEGYLSDLYVDVSHQLEAAGAIIEAPSPVQRAAKAA